MMWQQIETAPTDGQLFIGLREYGTTHHVDGTTEPLFWVRECFWRDGKFRDRSGLMTPSHWMPLPPLGGSDAS